MNIIIDLEGLIERWTQKCRNKCKRTKNVTETEKSRCEGSVQKRFHKLFISFKYTLFFYQSILRIITKQFIIIDSELFF